MGADPAAGAAEAPALTWGAALDVGADVSDPTAGDTTTSGAALKAAGGGAIGVGMEGEALGDPAFNSSSPPSDVLPRRTAPTAITPTAVASTAAPTSHNARLLGAGAATPEDHSSFDPAPTAAPRDLEPVSGAAGATGGYPAERGIARCDCGGGAGGRPAGGNAGGAPGGIGIVLFCRSIGGAG